MVAERACFEVLLPFSQSRKRIKHPGWASIHHVATHSGLTHTSRKSPVGLIPLFVFFFFVCFESNGKKRRRSRLQQLARWLYTAHLTQSSLSNVTFRKIKRCQHTTCHAKMFSNRKFDCFVSFLKKERKKQMKLVCAAIDNQSESQLAKGKTNGSELTGASLLISIHYVRDNNNSPRSLHFLLRISHLFFIFG